jgi:hypothetical protein
MVTEQEGRAWFDIIFEHASDSDGYPIRKFHAFGEGAPGPILNYPWYSADSTTWIIAAGMAARVIINDKALQFRAKFAKDWVSIMDDDTGNQRATWEEAFVEAGLDPEKCMKTEMRESDLMMLRSYMNAVHFLKLAERTRGVTTFDGAKSLILGKKYAGQEGYRRPNDGPIEFFFVLSSSSSPRALAVLTQLGVKNVLLSHFYNSPKAWEEIIVPYLYDPVKVCLDNPKIRKECEFLAQFLLNPVVK